MSQKNGDAAGVLSGSLLIAGTSIGAGMLGVPLITGLSGFFPSMLATTVCWLFMLFTGLLFLEATLWMEDGANVLSICERFLGPIGKWIGGGCFLFLYYCLLSAYFAAGAPLLNIQDPLTAALVFFAMFFLILISGLYLSDRINFFLILAMALSYAFLLALGSREVDSVRLLPVKWSYMNASFPVLFSAFGYHNIIPSISSFLKRDLKKLRQAIIIGSSIPFVVYCLWQWMIIGAIEQEALQEALEKGIPVTELFRIKGKAALLAKIAHFFSLFAIMTSVLGVSLSMFDFLADGLQAQRKKYFWKIALGLLVFLPPLFFSLQWPNIFGRALELAGGIGEAILNGILPICLVWVGRYRLKLKSVEAQTPFGKSFLALLFIFALYIVLLELGLIEWIKALG